MFNGNFLAAYCTIDMSMHPKYLVPSLLKIQLCIGRIFLLLLTQGHHQLFWWLWYGFMWFIEPLSTITWHSIVFIGHCFILFTWPSLVLPCLRAISLWGFPKIPSKWVSLFLSYPYFVIVFQRCHWTMSCNVYFSPCNLYTVFFLHLFSSPMHQYSTLLATESMRTISHSTRKLHLFSIILTTHL